jgi:purine/pyrimidine-nucleoside phosphorylase
MIKVNEYLDGKVKSLGFERDGVSYTSGVMMPGEYSFNTEREEHITVTLGELEVRPPGAGWRAARTGETVVIPAGVSFDLKVQKPATYLCMFR